MMNDLSHASAATAVDYDPFADAAPVARVAPTTEAQREIWLACQLGGDATLAYNESVSVRLRGRIATEALRRAVLGLVVRHDALRATFGADGLKMFIAESLAVDIPEHHLETLSQDAHDAALQAHIRADVDKPFDLEHGPLLRAGIVRFGPDEVVLILTAHHIVCDGWSFGVLLSELPALLPATEYKHHRRLRIRQFPAINAEPELLGYTDDYEHRSRPANHREPVADARPAA